MGIVNALMNIGIWAETTVEKIGTRTGAVPIQWEAGQNEGSLIQRLPRDPRERANRLARAQNIIVNEGETAVVLQDGKAQGALAPGFYGFDRNRLVATLDVIWVKTGQLDVKWGVGNVTSQDGIQVSANGMLYVRVVEPLAFNREVIRGALLLPAVEVQRFLMPRLQGVLRTTISQWPALELQAQRDAFNLAVCRNLGKVFQEMGLEIVDLEVIEVGLPAEFKAAVAQTTLAQHTGSAAVVTATHEAQIAQIEAVAEANRQLTAGMAQAQVMAQLQAQGINPLQLKALEALHTMAENPSEGGLIGGDFARAQLFGQVAAQALKPGAVMPPALAQPVPSAQLPTGAPPAAPQQPAGAPQAESVPQPAAASQDDIAALERSLDGLVERLAAGELSEDLFNKLSARIEAKLEKARGQ